MSHTLKQSTYGHTSEPSPFLGSHVSLAQMWEWDKATSRVYIFILMNLLVSSILHFLVYVDQNYHVCSEEEVCPPLCYLIYMKKEAQKKKQQGGSIQAKHYPK